MKNQPAPWEERRHIRHTTPPRRQEQRAEAAPDENRRSRHRCRLPDKLPSEIKNNPRRRWHRENQAKKKPPPTQGQPWPTYHPTSNHKARREEGDRVQKMTNHTRGAVNMQIQGGARGSWCAWPVRLRARPLPVGENKEAPQAATPRAASGWPRLML
jgi:hypothetical protein